MLIFTNLGIDTQLIWQNTQLFPIQGWKLKFQGQESTWLLFYILITVHNRHYKYYQKMQ